VFADSSKPWIQAQLTRTLLTVDVEQVVAMLFLSKKIGVSVLIASSLAFPLVSQARPFEGHLLGKTQLSYSESDRDVIRLGACPPNRKVTSLKVAATQGDADIRLLRVRYGNNQTEELWVRSRLNRGSETRWIDLKGNQRCVTAILIVGDTVNSSPRPATLQVYGR
jgi:Protein of unknown function (DUF2541)